MNNSTETTIKVGGLLALVALGACSAASVQKAETIAGKLCAYDAQLQPIVGAVISTTAPNAAPVVSVDNQVIHPAVVAACGTLPQLKVIVTPAPVVPPVLPVPVVPPK